MTIRNLDFLFKPKSIALIGASKRQGSVGAVLARNLLNREGGLKVHPVHPTHEEVEGIPAFRSVADLPEGPDLAVIATPPATIPGLIDELGARGTKAAVVISAGLGRRAGAEGASLRQEMLDAARPHLLRIAGPNCLGIMVPSQGLNASFAAREPETGRLAFVAQSGAVVSSVVDWASSRGIGFSYVVSLGDMSDVDFGDMLDYLANDIQTRSILLYIEAISDARKFLSAARAAARSKAVIVVKAGRHAEGAKAAASHTGALAGADEVYDAAFRRAGMLRVMNLDELFDAVETVGKARLPKDNRLAILTNGGGFGVMATDALIDYGGRLAELSPEVLAELEAVLPPTWSRGNPVDIIGDADGLRYAKALEILVQAASRKENGIDGLLVLNCPTAVASSTEAAQAVVESIKSTKKLPILTSWVGEDAALESRRLFAEHSVPTYETPQKAVGAFTELVTYRLNQTELMQTPPSIPEGFTPDREAAQAVIGAALADGRDWLTEPEAKQVLAAYDIPVSPTRVAETPESAAAVAAELGGSVALKILSRDITHKTDVGGVALDLRGPGSVAEAAAAMAARVAEKRPEARIDGFTVQPMIRRPGAYELIMGVLSDRQFGPVLLFGEGGTGVEVIDDKALALPPLNMKLARDVMARTRIYRLLQGYRGLPPTNLDAVAFTLVKLSQLVVDLESVAELDINPLLADEYGVMALDARVRVEEADSAAKSRLAIRPYPSELEEEIPLADERRLLLRPVVPEDEPAFQRAFAKLTPEEIRLRFFVPMRTISHEALARATQIDYDREMALVLTDPGIPGQTEVYGVVRMSADPDNERAEYAIIIGGEMTGQGLGMLLMRRIINYARNRGIKELFGDVLRDNRTMLKLCDILGFTRRNDAEEPSIVRVTLTLQEDAKV